MAQKSRRHRIPDLKEPCDPEGSRPAQVKQWPGNHRVTFLKNSVYYVSLLPTSTFLVASNLLSRYKQWFVKKNTNFYLYSIFLLRGLRCPTYYHNYFINILGKKHVGIIVLTLCTCWENGTLITEQLTFTGHLLRARHCYKHFTFNPQKIPMG